MNSNEDLYIFMEELWWQKLEKFRANLTDDISLKWNFLEENIT